MAQDSADLAALIGSRICHDLVSPVGAISNGLELLGLTGAVEGPELDLITDSAENAGARIRFFRIAFGAAGNQMLGQTEVASVLADLSRGGRIDMRWCPKGDVPRSAAQLAFLALLCLETGLPYGGTVQVTRAGDDWTVTGEAGKVCLDNTLWDPLAAGQRPETITPAQVQFALLPLIARDNGRKLALARGDNRVVLSF